MKDLFNKVSYEIVDLNKSKANLVPKKVPIRQENGKVSYGIRWVNPNKDVGSEEGGRVSSEEEIPPSIQDIMDNNAPVSDTSAEELPQSPTTEEITDSNRSLYESGVMFDPNLSSYANEMQSRMDELLDMNDMDGLLEEVYDIVYHNISSIESGLVDDINKSENPDIFVQNVQKEMIRKDKVRESRFTMIGSNPKVLKQVLMMTLGDNKYKSLTRLLGKSNLTINTPPENITSILDNGYRGKTIEDLVRKHLDNPDECLKQLDDMVQEIGDDMNTVLRRIDELSQEDSNWHLVSERLGAESESMCLNLEDRRPCYIAFNPSGSTDGPTQFYGTGVVEVSDDILEHCTVCKDDSFNCVECIPKVYGKDHLKDLYLLKMCDMRPEIMEDSLDSIMHSNWLYEFTEDSDLPLEIQYHQPQVDVSKMRLINEG